MSYALDYAPLAFQAEQSQRAAFIRRTYAHLAGAILAFTAIEFAIFSLLDVQRVVGSMFAGRASWLLVMVAFIGVGWLANYWAHSQASQSMQYLGLGLYVVAEAIIFLPLLYIASKLSDSSIIPSAAILTLSMFGGLTLSALVTRKDFSFLAPIISIGSMLALGLVVAAMFIPSVSFGLVVAFGIVALACASILFQTSNVIHHYRTNQHVAASLGLFASVATLFYHILWILINTRNN